MVVLGILIAIYALNIDVSVTVPARDFGYGVSTPQTTVANLELMSRRQNTLIFGGILAIIGAIFSTFGSRSESKDRSSEGEPKQLVVAQPDRVEFHDGKFTVGVEVFDSFEKADDYLKRISK
ncbi:hypothetical protein GTP81_17670 [Rugamonas sp. FT107W]|uniref:Uncharacterized protein n=1 Tax=Duganella vulcania TaxID=2692166 RepID=A0A845HIG6_9BURK|nr:hypothetical protein [Duganella vulcania]MYN18580.1 hypothetical protein [Duganella vulcania]